MLFWGIKGFMSRYPQPGTHIKDCATIIEIGKGYPIDITNLWPSFFDCTSLIQIDLQKWMIIIAATLELHLQGKRGSLLLLSLKHWWYSRCSDVAVSLGKIPVWPSQACYFCKP